MSFAGFSSISVASSLLATLIDQNPVGAIDADGRQEAALSRFFWLYSAAHAWFIGIDHLIGNGWTFSTTMSALLASKGIVLAVVRGTRVRWLFTIAIATIMIVDVVMQNFGVVT